MLKRFITAAALAVALVLPAQAQIKAGEKSLGPKLGFASHNTSAFAGLVFNYAFSQHLRIAPQIGCVFRHKDRDALLIDLDFHVPFGIVSNDKAALYPLAGLAFNSWSRHGVDITSGEDVTSHINRFGGNLGAGFDLRCNQSLRLNFEAKYTLVKSYSSLYIGAGISYVF